MNENPFKNEKLAIKVELAKPEDWALCKELRLKSLKGPSGRMLAATPELIEEEEKKTEEEWRQETSSDKMFSVIAKVGERAVGLGRTKLLNEGWPLIENWRIRNGWVDPEFEGQGIQTKMIALRLKEIIKRGGIIASSNARVDNPISLHNLEKLGFKIMSSDSEWHQVMVDLRDVNVIDKIDQVLNAG